MKIKDASSTMLFVVKLYIKNAPFKLLWECVINATKNIMTVLTSVWLLEHLTKMILNDALFLETLLPLGVISALNLLIDLIQKYYTNCLKPQSDLKLKTHFEKILLDHAKSLPIQCYENSEFYTNVQQAQDGVSAVFSVYDDFINVFAHAAAIISAVKVVVDIDPILLFFVVFTIPMIAINQRIGKVSASKKLDLKPFDRKKNYAKEVWLSKNFVREFKTSNAEKIPDKHYEDAYDGAMDLHSSYGKKLFKISMLGRCFSITSISILSYLYCIIKFTYSDTFDISAVSVIVVAIMNMISRIRKVYHSYGNICGHYVQLSALNIYLNYKLENENENGYVPGVFESLEFCNVWFSYDKKNWVLKDISFKINAGEKISFVGYNGAGKSTIIKLLLRFYDVDRGEILYNGVNIKEYRLKDYRKKFSAAFQDYQIFSVALAENILMGKYTLPRKAEVYGVLNDLNMKELVGNEMCILGREYDKNGLVLSGGQQQKIAVSRLKFTSFDIALLDEPSAALDPISSDNMLNSVIRLVENKTMIIVSHDMSFSKIADRIMFFENGELSGVGSHAELIDKNREYASFFKCQAESFNKIAGEAT